jgi:hypothetical protein
MPEQEMRGEQLKECINKMAVDIVRLYDVCISLTERVDRLEDIIKKCPGIKKE